jgi:hypothetical protein
MIPAVSHRIRQNEHLRSIVWHFTEGEITILKGVLIDNNWINNQPKWIENLIEQI